MDKRTKKETQSKRGAKKTPKPKYNLWQNTGFMLRTSRKYAKSVFPLCIGLALLSAGKSVAELLIAPAILNKIELSASLGSVVFTIAAFALVLMLLSGLGPMLIRMRCSEESPFGVRESISAFPANMPKHPIRTF